MRRRDLLALLGGVYVVLIVAMLLLGKTAFAGALLSALAGIGTVAVTYVLGMHGWGARVASASSRCMNVLR